MIQGLIKDLYNGKISESEFRSIIQQEQEDSVFINNQMLDFILEVFNKGLLNDYLGLK